MIDVKKILFVIDDKVVSGAVIQLEDILKNINLDKFDIDVLVLNNKGTCLLKIPDNIDIIYGDISDKKVLSFFINKTSNLFNLTKMIIGKERRKLISKQYDIEIAFSEYIAPSFVAYGDCTRKICWIHQNNQKLNVFDKFDEIVAVSNNIKENFLKTYRHNNITVIHNIIDEVKIEIKAREEYVRFSKKRLNFISVGKITYDKGYDRLINIFDKLKKEELLDNVILRIIGDGVELDKLKKKVIEKELDDNIKFMGQIKNPYPYIIASDWFVLSSRNEAFGMVIIESLITGTPIITTKIPTINEFMNDDFGIIVDNDDFSLYEAIKKVIINRNILTKYSNNLKDYHYDSKGIIKEIEFLLNK